MANSRAVHQWLTGELTIVGMEQDRVRMPGNHVARIVMPRSFSIHIRKVLAPLEHIVSKNQNALHGPECKGRVVRHSVSRCVWASLFSLLLAMFAGCGGCGGSSQPTTLDPTKPWGGLGSREAYMAWKEEQERKEVEEEAAAKKAAESRPRVSDSVQAEEEPDQRSRRSPRPVAVRQVPDEDVSPPDDAPEQDAPPPIPLPPGDLTQWQERDYFIAKLLEKPELLEAIARSAVDKRDDEAIVQILTRLLQPEVYAGLKELVFGSREEEEAGTSSRRRIRRPLRSRAARDSGSGRLARHHASGGHSRQARDTTMRQRRVCAAAPFAGDGLGVRPGSPRHPPPTACRAIGVLPPQLAAPSTSIG